MPSAKHPYVLALPRGVLVDRSPEVELLPVELDEHLVEVPSVVGTLLLPTPKASSVFDTEPLAPSTDGLVGDLNASFGEQILDITEAEGEPEVEPDGMADDLGRESVSTVADGCVVHGPDSATSRLKLTVPRRLRQSLDSFTVDEVDNVPKS